MSENENDSIQRAILASGKEARMNNDVLRQLKDMNGKLESQQAAIVELEKWRGAAEVASAARADHVEYRFNQLTDTVHEMKTDLSASVKEVEKELSKDLQSVESILNRIAIGLLLTICGAALIGALRWFLVTSYVPA